MIGTDLRTHGTSVTGREAIRATACDWPAISGVWDSLSQRCPQRSIFVAKKWVETWLNVYGRDLDVTPLVFEASHGTVGACLLTRGHRRLGVLPLRRVSLNASGEDPRDTTYIEFNALLCEGGWEEAVAAKLAGLLQRESWDEFALDGFQDGLAYEALKRHFTGLTLCEEWRNSYYVNLASLRREGKSFQSCFSSHRGKLLRQNLRSYSRFGPVKLHAALNLPAALEWFDELAVWNIRRARDLGRKSVFASPKFKTFHRELIRRSLAQGAVELIRLQAGDETIGLLYNLVDAGKVYFYQSGFNYGLGQRLSPGTVTLAFAIQRALDQGYDDWDFLAGEDEYKKVLATGARRLVWALFRRSTFKTRLEDAAHNLRSRLLPEGPHE
jgi:hypothetical protein